MFVEDVGFYPAELGGSIELDTYVVIDRTDRCLPGNEEGVGLAKDREAPCRIGFLRGSRNQAVVCRVAPAGAIVAIAGNEHIGKSVWIRIITHPARAGDPIVERGKGI